MALEEVKENLEDIQENTKAYIDTSLAYYKLWGFKVAMKSTTLALKFFLIAVCLVIVLLFVSVVKCSIVIHWVFYVWQGFIWY
jgi:hypothetical protein